MHCHLKTFARVGRKWRGVAGVAWSKNVLFQGVPIEMGRGTISQAFECLHRLFKLNRTFHKVKRSLSIIIAV
jgi:hypothetical protein